jgi:hypothetical protein
MGIPALEKIKLLDLLIFSERIVLKLEKKQDDFSAFFPSFNEKFFQELKELLGRIHQLPSNERLAEQYHQFSKQREVLLERGRMVICMIQDTLPLAFKTSSSQIEYLKELFKEEQQSEQFLKLLSLIIGRYREYQVELSGNLLKDSWLLELQKVQKGLNRLNQEYRNFLKYRAIKFQERKLMTKSLYRRVVEISQMSRVIYSQSSQEYSWFQWGETGELQNTTCKIEKVAW